MGKYKVIVAEEALLMLGSFIDVIASKDSKAASAWKNQIYNSINTLSDFPFMYPILDLRDSFLKKYHKCVVNKQVVILYQIEEDKVYIDWIIESNQDLYRLL